MSPDATYKNAKERRYKTFFAIPVKTYPKPGRICFGMILELPWQMWHGPKTLRLSFPDAWQVKAYGPSPAPCLPDTLLRQAICRPIESVGLAELCAGKRTVSIAIDDLNRPTERKFSSTDPSSSPIFALVWGQSSPMPCAGSREGFSWRIPLGILLSFGIALSWPAGSGRLSRTLYHSTVQQASLS